jgi:hypothetical protein
MTRDGIEHWLGMLEQLQIRARDYARHFAGIESVCLFAGYPKSGHSLVGALLDAHPDMVVAHELDVLRCLRAGLSRELIFALMVETAAAFHRAGHHWHGFDYSVEGQWQGRFRRLRVLGDKKGGGTSQQLLDAPELLDRLHATLELPVKFIHVTRHPLENIASISRQFGTPLPQAAEHYFALAESVARLKGRVPAESLCEFRYEDFASAPRQHLIRLCGFLGLDGPEDYLEAAAGRVRPPTPRAGIPWPPGLVPLIAERSAGYPFLAGYGFES